MGLMDKIKKEQNDPTVVVPLRPDPLNIEDKKADIQTKTPQRGNEVQGDHLFELEEQLSSYPTIASKKLGLRLEETLLEELQVFCKKNKITPETLFEALYTQTASKETSMNRVVKDAQDRMRKRTEAGNIRSMITKFKNLRGMS